MNNREIIEINRVFDRSLGVYRCMDLMQRYDIEKKVKHLITSKKEEIINKTEENYEYGWRSGYCAVDCRNGRIWYLSNPYDSDNIPPFFICVYYKKYNDKAGNMADERIIKKQLDRIYEK